MFITKELCDANKLVSSLWKLVVMSSMRHIQFYGSQKVHEVTYTAKKPNDIWELHNCGLSVSNESMQYTVVHRNLTCISVSSRIQYSHPHPPLFCLDWCIFSFSQVFAQNRLGTQSHYKGNAFSLTFFLSSGISFEQRPSLEMEEWSLRSGVLGTGEEVGGGSEGRDEPGGGKSQWLQEVPGGCEEASLKYNLLSNRWQSRVRCSSVTSVQRKTAFGWYKAIFSWEAGLILSESKQEVGFKRSDQRYCNWRCSS